MHACTAGMHVQNIYSIDWMQGMYGVCACALTHVYNYESVCVRAPSVHERTHSRTHVNSVHELTPRTQSSK